MEQTAQKLDRHLREEGAATGLPKVTSVPRRAEPTGQRRPREGTSSSTFFPSLSRLRAFVEAARVGSISHASAELRRSQSTVTQAILNLEADLGADLLKRTSAGCFLTEGGAILRTRVEACFARLETGVREAIRGRSQKAVSPELLAQRINRPQILAFIHLNEHGSFAQAARHAGLSVKSLRRSARSLEQQLGVRLLQNTAQGLRPNESGFKLASQMTLAARELKWAREEIKARSGILDGRLVIGSVMMAGTNFIAVELDRFIKDHPEININVVTSTSDVLLNKLREGHIDFIIGILKNPPPAEDVEEISLAEDTYVIAAGRNHPLAARRGLSAQDLASSEWLGSHARADIFRNIFADAPAPRFSVETSSIPAIFILLNNGDRIAILLRSELALDRALGEHLVALDHEVKADPISIGVTVRRHWKPTPVQDIFMTFLRDQFSST